MLLYRNKATPLKRRKSGQVEMLNLRSPRSQITACGNFFFIRTLLKQKMVMIHHEKPACKWVLDSSRQGRQGKLLANFCFALTIMRDIDWDILFDRAI
ncbi:hypothetical protein BDW75DRAFT_6847 [Aspergillus navahoensis]